MYQLKQKTDEAARSIATPPGWDASPSQDYPQHICWYPFVHLGEEKHCESEVSCLRTQRPWPGLEPGPLDLELSALTMRPAHLHN